MCPPELLVFGVVGVLMGPPMAVWPYRIARWSEIFDAIGRRPAGRVEPAGWNVALTKWTGIGATGFGGLALLACLAG